MRAIESIFYNALDKYFPGMKNKYIRTYGNADDCHGPNNERLLDLWNIFNITSVFQKMTGEAVPECV